MSIYLGNNLIAPNQSNAANKSLSNLDSTGQSILNNKADRDLSNLSTTGQSILDNKANVSLSNVNNNAKILMGGLGMPSNKYIDLTFGASGSTYTAPANGYYNIARQVSAQGQYVDLVNNTTGFFVSMQKDAVGMIRISIPVRKGDVLQINYTTAGGSNNFFRFFYAQGSESEAN
jgi:hypothetical protein